MISINTLVAQAFTALALILSYLANSWLVEGYGLNPWLALPFATICMAVPHVLNHYFIEVEPDEEDELSCIQLKTPTQR